jgi:hypothetical protein
MLSAAACASQSAGAAHRVVALLLGGQLQANAGAVHEQDGHARHLREVRVSHGGAKLRLQRHAPCAAFRAAFRPACPRRSAPRWRAPQRRLCFPLRSPGAPSRQTSHPAPAPRAPSLRANVRQLPARQRGRACASRAHAPA